MDGVVPFPMATESLHGRALGADELQSIRTELEGISSIAVVDSAQL